MDGASAGENALKSLAVVKSIGSGRNTERKTERETEKEMELEEKMVGGRKGIGRY